MCGKAVPFRDCPLICSGLAYSGVITRTAVAVNSASASPSACKSFAMPKSKSFGSPSLVTKIFDGLRSRWITRFWCAYCTAEQTVRKSLSRSLVLSLVSFAYLTITWSNPSNIVYGSTLSGTQLNASASVTGAAVNPLVYTPASGTVLHAGNTQNLHVVFTPDDTSNYNTATKDVSINVTKATLTITADDKSKGYRAANPTFTFTPTGFVNGDTASLLTGAPSFSTTATATSVVNTYTITITPNTL